MIMDATRDAASTSMTAAARERKLMSNDEVCLVCSTGKEDNELIVCSDCNKEIANA